MTRDPHTNPIAAKDTVIVIAGCNGLATARSWVRQLVRHASCRHAAAYSWRNADQVLDLLAAPPPARVTLVGHSLGGGHAQLIAERLPAGTISTLITVAPFAPRGLDTELVRRKVGWWLNIVPARRWHDPLLNLAARFFMGWREQGAIAAASENYVSSFPHQDFYRMMSDRCGAAEHGQYRPPGAADA